MPLFLCSIIAFWVYSRSRPTEDNPSEYSWTRVVKTAELDVGDSIYHYIKYE